MDSSWHVLRDIVVLLAAAMALGLVFERFKLSAMLGYLVAGLVLGPSALRLVGDETMGIASEAGIAMLLFTIGLETSWRRFRALGSQAIGGGIVQVACTAGVVALAAAALGIDWRIGLVLGLCVSMSSTATVLQSLAERGEQDSLHGRAALGVLLLQDAAVVPAVLLTGLLAKGGTLADLVKGLSTAAVNGLLLIVVLIFVCGRLMPRILTAAALARSRELPILLAVVSCLGAAVAAHAAGLSAAMGAFVAGMILADSPMATQMRADVGPLRAVLVTLFFASVGMQADLHWLASWPNAALVLTLVAMVIVVKTAITAGALRLFGASRATAAAGGLCLAQIGEFSFVLADEAHDSMLFSDDVFQAVATTTLITLLLTPLLVRGARRFARVAARGERVALIGPAVGDEPHVLLVGYGPAGREVVQQLRDAELPVTLLETNPRSVEAAKADGLRAFVGDASRFEVLEHAGLRAALVVVIAIPDHVSAAQIIAELRAHRPHVPIIARARYHQHAQRLRLGTEETIVDEEEAVGRLLGFEAYLAAEAARKGGHGQPTSNQ